MIVFTTMRISADDAYTLTREPVCLYGETRSVYGEKTDIFLQELSVDWLSLIIEEIINPQSRGS